MTFVNICNNDNALLYIHTPEKHVYMGSYMCGMMTSDTIQSLGKYINIKRHNSSKLKATYGRALSQCEKNLLILCHFLSAH